jgi:hypothetical protein
MHCLEISTLKNLLIIYQAKIWKKIGSFICDKSHINKYINFSFDFLGLDVDF